MNNLSHHGYSAGHPWYYLLGGAIPQIGQIESYAHASQYKGYLAADIEQIDAKDEPQKSKSLKVLRAKIKESLRDDISMYRAYACKLRKYRQQGDDAHQHVCSDIHTAMSLKFNHIYNGFANLKTLDALPEQQLEMF